MKRTEAHVPREVMVADCVTLRSWRTRGRPQAPDAARCRVCEAPLGAMHRVGCSVRQPRATRRKKTT